MTAQFFGERWDAPRVGNATQVPTPVGVPCLDCGEPVVAGDRGLVVPVLVGPEEEWAWGYKSWELHGTKSGVVIAPVHMECDLRLTCSHLVRQCGCYREHATVRDESRATLEELNRWRMAQGLGQM